MPPTDRIYGQPEDWSGAKISLLSPIQASPLAPSSPLADTTVVPWRPNFIHSSHWRYWVVSKPRHPKGLQHAEMPLLLEDMKEKWHNITFEYDAGKWSSDQLQEVDITDVGLNVPQSSPAESPSIVGSSPVSPYADAVQYVPSIASKNRLYSPNCALNSFLVTFVWNITAFCGYTIGIIIWTSRSVSPPEGLCSVVALSILSIWGPNPCGILG